LYECLNKTFPPHIPTGLGVDLVEENPVSSPVCDMLIVTIVCFMEPNKHSF